MNNCYAPTGPNYFLTYCYSIFGKKYSILFALCALLSPSLNAATRTLSASLTGGAENPAVMTMGSGSATLMLDDVSGAWSLTGSFTGMTGNSSAAHIHGPAPTTSNAGVITGLIFTSGATAGSLSGSGTLTSAQMMDILAGLYYVNIHSSFAGGGEVRGQLSEALPIELIKFNATTSNNMVQLTWQTANEINFKGFDVQKSEGNNEWQTMGFVVAKGKSNLYNFEDNQANAVTYYRLRLIDNDGSEKHSNVVSVLVRSKGKAITLFPNPTKGVVYLSSSDFQPTCVKIYNSTGQLLSNVNSDCHAASNEINMSNLPNGFYQIELTNGIETLQKRIVKE